MIIINLYKIRLSENILIQALSAKFITYTDQPSAVLRPDQVNLHKSRVQQ